MASTLAHMHWLNEPAGIFALVMAAAIIAPYLSDALGLPAAASIALIGILLGPQVAGLLESNILIQFAASLGLIYVFFAAGAEVPLSLLKKRAKPALIFGVLSFVIPFVLGAAFAFLFFSRHFIPAVLFGAFLASSGSLVLQPVVRGDLLNRESAEAARGGTGLARILIACIVFVVGLLSPEGTFSFSLGTIALWLLYFAALYFLLPRAAALFLRKTKAKDNIDALFILFFIFACAWLGSFIGLPEQLGAFYAGLLLAPLLSVSKSVYSRVEFFGDAFLLPFFFIFIGLSADFSRVASLPITIALVSGSVALGLGSKFLAAYAAGKLLGYSRADRGLLFGFSSTFAAFSLALAAVAGRSGFFDQSLASQAILLAIISSSLASLAAHNAGTSILFRKSRGQPSTVRPRERILVALSKPQSAQLLMDLAISLHDPDAVSPLFPLAVISETEEDSRQKAETMLAAALMRAVAAQVPVIPLSRVEVNAAQGILDSAAQQRIDTIIIGWNRPPRLANAFFGSVIDQIVNGGNQMVLVARAIASFDAAQVVLVLPAFCDRHSGFPRALRVLDALVRGRKTKLHILSLPGQGARMGRALKEAGITAPAQIFEVESWKDIGKAFAKLPAAPKLFVLFSARPSEPSWHPAIERLPHRIGEEFAGDALLMLYMAGRESTENANPEQGGQEEPACEEQPTALSAAFGAAVGASSHILEKAAERGNIRVNMRHAAIADGILELVSSAFPFDKKRSGRIASRFSEIVQRHPIEIYPGVVLLHDRVGGIVSPIVCFGSHRQGFKVSVLERQIKALIVIFIPENASSEEHLSFLGEIAHLFKERNLAQRLIEAESPEDVLS